MLPQIQVPDIASSIARVEQIKQSRLQQLAAQQGMQDAQRLQGVLGEVGPALFGTDPAAQQTALQRLLAEGGQGALPVAFNAVQLAEGRAARAADEAHRDRMFQLQQHQIGNANRPQYTYQVGEDGQIYALDQRNPSAQPIPTGFRPQATRQSEPLAEVNTPEGPRLVPRSQAVGMEPAPRSPQTVINNQGDNSFDREMGQSLAKRIDALDQAGTRAVRQINTLGRVERAMSEFETGAAAGARLTVGRVAQMLGIPDSALPQGMSKDALASGEFIQAQMGRALTEMIGSGGFPAQAFSNADREMLERSIFNIATTPGGNKLIIDTMRRAAQIDRDIAGAWREWQRENGSTRESAERFFRDRVPQIVTEDPYAAIIAAGQNQPAPGNTIPGPGGVGTATPPPAPTGGGWSIRPVR